MKICFPVFQNHGLASPVYNHFGSAPMTLIVDVESRSIIEVLNCDLYDRHDSCRALKSLQEHSVDAIVTDGIGAGAAAEYRQAGMKIYQAHAGTVADNLERILRQELPELTPDKSPAGTILPVNDDDDDLPPRFGCGF